MGDKHTAKVKWNEKRPRKKLGCAFCIFVEYKIKRKFTFFVKYQRYFILCCENISIFTCAMHSCKLLIFFTALDEIYLVLTSKIKYPLYIIPNSCTCKSDQKLCADHFLTFNPFLAIHNKCHLSHLLVYFGSLYCKHYGQISTCS